MRKRPLCFLALVLAAVLLLLDKGGAFREGKAPGSSGDTGSD